MKFLKKPIFIKKIRSYNNDVKLTTFSLENKSNFIPKNNIIKSSYLEKVIDFGNDFSTVYMKGGYFYSKNSTNKSTYFTLNKNKFIDSYFIDYNKSLNVLNDGGIKNNLIKNYFNFVIFNNKSAFFLLKKLNSNILTNKKIVVSK